MGASDHNAIIIGDVSGNGSNTITVGNSDSSGVYIHGIRQNTSETAKTVMYNTSTKQLTYNPFITTPVGAIMMWSAPGVTLPPADGWSAMVHAERVRLRGIVSGNRRSLWWGLDGWHIQSPRYEAEIPSWLRFERW